MKIIALGDIHGRTQWKRILEHEFFDKVIFIGDYFDSRDEPPVSARNQIKNFNEIVDLKRKQPEKVILLTGNHDYQYLPESWESYSGFQKFHQKAIREAISGPYSEGLLQMCHVHANMLFSHAGVTKTWCENNFIDTNNLEESINQLFWNDFFKFGFTPGNENSNIGDEPEQPPTWVRPESLKRDKIPGFVHIVGHTTQDRLLILNDIILIDTLGKSGEYLVVEDGVPYPMTVWDAAANAKKG